MDVIYKLFIVFLVLITFSCKRDATSNISSKKNKDTILKIKSLNEKVIVEIDTSISKFKIIKPKENKKFNIKSKNHDKTIIFKKKCQTTELGISLSDTVASIPKNLRYKKTAYKWLKINDTLLIYAQSTDLDISYSYFFKMKNNCINYIGFKIIGHSDDEDDEIIPFYNKIGISKKTKKNYFELQEWNNEKLVGQIVRISNNGISKKYIKIWISLKKTNKKKLHRTKNILNAG